MSASTAASPPHKAYGGGPPYRPASSESALKSSYQLQQYTNSPRHKDPYTPGHGEPRRAGTVISGLDVVLSSLQKNNGAFKL